MNVFAVRARALSWCWLFLASLGASAVPDFYRTLSSTYGLLPDPTPEAFSVCYEHSCKEVAEVGLSPAQWQAVRQIFDSPAADAAAERELIRQAVAYLESVVSPLVGAAGDRGGNLAGLISGGSQMDCVDESTNTTTYLALIEREGLLQWHRVAGLSTRGFIIFGWPHTTAVIEQREDGARWAVDSWFHDNGVAPEVLPIAQWKKGWSPAGFAGF